MDAIDNAAAAALWSLRYRPQAVEHLGVLYGDGLQRSNIVSQDSRGRVSGRFEVPAGSLRALFHNHPPGDERDQFSLRDRMNADRLKVPSYISAGDRVMRYDPATKQSSEVLAEFPMDEFRAYLMRTLLDRAPDDPRGLMR